MKKKSPVHYELTQFSSKKFAPLNVTSPLPAAALSEPRKKNLSSKHAVLPLRHTGREKAGKVKAAQFFGGILWNEALQYMYVYFSKNVQNVHRSAHFYVIWRA